MKLLLTIVLAIGVLAGAVAVVAAQHSESSPSVQDCRIGGKPTLDLPRVPPEGEVKLTSPVEVVGCNQSPDGEIQLVAYGTSDGLCISEDLPSLGRTQGGTCKPRETSWHTYCGRVCIWGVGKVGATFHTFVVGGADSSVRKVAIDTGKQHHSEVVEPVTEVSGELLGSLGQSEQFSVFGVILSACVEVSSIKVQALDAGGRVVGSADGGLGLPRPCKR